MGGKTADLTDQRFERLRVLSRDWERSKQARTAYWRCQCDCGNIAFATSSMLRSGRHKSCGCLKRERTAERSTKHGAKPRSGASPTYNSWMNMLRRCTNPDHPRYPDWGGRGITVCSRWLSFDNFLADMGEKPPNLTLDRIDNDGNYEPGNCQWATPHQQRINRRSWLTPETERVIVQLRAEGILLREIGNQIGVSAQAISRALRRRATK